jgi:hypothetical protein
MRDFILVVGNQQCGKSVWSKAYAKHQTRLLCFDPLASYVGVDFSSHPDEWLSPLVNGRLNEFRYGVYWKEELPMIAHAAAAAGNCMLLIEECALCFDKGEKIPDWLTQHIFMGSHIGVDRLFVAQRAASVPVDVRSQASRIVTFRQTEPNDVRAICERIGREYAEELPTLPKLECLDWEVEGGTLKRYSVHPEGPT